MPMGPAAEDPRPQLPPWMADLEAKITGGYDKVGNLIVLQNSRLDTSEASMTKPPMMTKEKMDNLEPSGFEERAHSCEEKPAAIDVRISSKSSHAREQGVTSDPRSTIRKQSHRTS